MEIARSIYNNLRLILKDNTQLWKESLNFEKIYGTVNSQEKIILEAIDNGNQEFKLIYGHFINSTKSVKEANEYLTKLLNENDKNEDIVLAIVKLETELNNFEKAIQILNQAKQDINSEKIWLACIKLERYLEFKNLKEQGHTLKLCKEAVSKFPFCAKFYEILGELYEESNKFKESIVTLEEGIKNNKKAINLYNALAQVYRKYLNQPATGRSIFEKGCRDNINNPKIWAFAIDYEISENQSSSNSLIILNNAIKNNPNSDLLFSYTIDLEKSNKHAKIEEALSKFENSALIMLACAKVFMNDKNFEKARKWFELALKTDKNNGDIWLQFYKFESLYGSEVNNNF